MGRWSYDILFDFGSLLKTFYKYIIKFNRLSINYFRTNEYNISFVCFVKNRIGCISKNKRRNFHFEINCHFCERLLRSKYHLLNNNRDGLIKLNGVN